MLYTLGSVRREDNGTSVCETVLFCWSNHTNVINENYNLSFPLLSSKMRIAKPLSGAAGEQQENAATRRGMLYL